MLEPPRVEIDPKRPPTEPVVVEAPPFGSLTVRVLAPDGEPIASPKREANGTADGEADRRAGSESNVESDSGPGDDEALVRLRLENEERDSWTYDSRDSRYGKTTGGRLRFDGVEIDRRFTVEAMRKGFRAAKQVTAGPTLAGETVEVSLRLGEATPRWTARLLDAEGKPLRERGVALARIGGRGMTEYALRNPSRSTDAEGRLTVDLGSSTGRLEYEIRVPHEGAESPTGFDPEWMGEVTIDAVAPGPGAVIDAGDVRLRRAPLLAAGTVVDVQGRPLAGASVRSSVRGGSVPTSRTLRTDENGAFRLHGPLPDGELRIGASKTGYEPAAVVTVTPGAEHLRFVLERATRIVGRVHLGGDLDAKWIRLALETSEGEESIRLGGDAEFSRRTVPGPAVLRLRLRGHDEPLREIEVTLEEGETLDVGEISLGDVLLVAEITVTMPDGEPIRSARVWKHPATESSAFLGATDRFGHLRFGVMRAPTELVVIERGRALTRATWNGEPLTVVVETGWRVRFPFAGDDAAAVDWSEVYGRIRAIGSAAEDLPPTTDFEALLAYEKEESGTFGFSVPRPGTYEFWCTLYRFGPFLVDGERQPSVSLPIGDPIRVEVLDVEAEQVFPYSFGLDAYDALRSRVDALETIR
jgi:hypothetical protein